MTGAGLRLAVRRRLAARFVLPLLALAMAGLIQFAPWLASGEGDIGTTVTALLATVLLCGAAFSAVAHADVVADRVGRPLGTLLLTLSVTVIEVSVIASLMLSGPNNPTLARESVLSVIMFTCAGIVGLCLLLGGLKHREQEVSQQGLAGYLAVIFALGILLLVLPNDTHAGTHGAFSTFQLVFIAIVAAALYFVFLYMQTVRYREHYSVTEVERGPRPSRSGFLSAIGFLLASLCGVVALSHVVAHGFEAFIGQFPLPDPDAVTGALVAALLLLPEGLSAVRAAARNQLQLSLNIALGSALATIALTIPAMAFISVVIDRPMVLGLDPEDRTLMVLTFAVSILSFGTGKTNALMGMVHVIICFVYLMLVFVP